MCLSVFGERVRLTACVCVFVFVWLCSMWFKVICSNYLDYLRQPHVPPTTCFRLLERLFSRTHTNKHTHTHTQTHASMQEHTQTCTHTHQGWKTLLLQLLLILFNRTRLFTQNKTRFGLGLSSTLS